MKTIVNGSDPAALRLMMAIKKLRARLREVAPAGATGLPLAHLAIIRHLRIGGSATAAELASAEHVSQQAIAQALARLRKAGLVEARPDPSDRRKSVISITDAGNALFESVLDSRGAWLVRAIDRSLAPDELPALEKAIKLLERIADID